MQMSYLRDLSTVTEFAACKLYTCVAVSFVSHTFRVILGITTSRSSTFDLPLIFLRSFGSS
jgi:hypothetical protein